MRNASVTCPECWGVGESFPMVVCATCKGTGEVTPAWTSPNEKWAIIPDRKRYRVDNLREGTTQTPVWGRLGLLWDNHYEVPKYVRDAAERVIPRR